MNKNILILGAGFLQKPAIEAAKKIVAGTARSMGVDVEA